MATALTKTMTHLKTSFWQGLSACMLLALVSSVHAWSSVGHKVVAHIAYDHLSPTAKKAVDQLTADPEKRYSGRSRFAYGATWADWSRDHGDSRFREWHYIDLPLSAAGQKTQPPKPINAVYGIQRCQATLRNPQASLIERQTCLKLLVHIVGDLHQPLHAVARYTPLHPRGDRGGNSVVIQSKVADNLHAYWDRGLGQFKPLQRRSPTTGVRIWQYAEEIQERYPIERYAQSQASTALLRSQASAETEQGLLTVPPIEWAREGRVLAEAFVYTLPEMSAPSPAYHDQGVPIMEERLALAGYRLATMLNALYNNK